MDLNSSRVCIAPGDGLVARYPSVIVFAAPTGDHHDAFLDELLVICSEGPKVASDIIRKVASLVTRKPADSVPSFGILAQGDDGLVAVVVGDVVLTSTSPHGDESVDGKDVYTFVERRVRGDVEHVLLAGPEAPSVDPRSSLTSGVVRGAGISLATAGSVEMAPSSSGDQGISEQTHLSIPAIDLDETTAPRDAGRREGAAAKQEEAPFEPISLDDDDDDDDNEDELRAVETRGDSAHSAPETVMVHGIYCSRDHFNSPESIFCTQCGISMVQQTHNRVSGPRPPLGVLVSDQGEVFSLVTDYVIGREPDLAAEIASGSALPMVLRDPKFALSRIHARVLLDGWEVRIQDSGSANGTFVAVSPEDTWDRLAPDEIVTIRPGARISVGGRVLAFETHQRT